MTTAQMILAALGTIVIGSQFVNVDKIKSFLKSKVKARVKKADVELDAVEKEPEDNMPEKENMIKEPKVVHVVQLWENLRELCEEYDLRNSLVELDKAFPTFLDVVKKEVSAPVAPVKEE